MAEIKNLNIEELSDAIVNKIAPAMEGISENVDKMGSSSSDSKETSIATTSQTQPPKTEQPTSATTTLAPDKPKDYTEVLENIKNLLQEYLDQ